MSSVTLNVECMLQRSSIFARRKSRPDAGSFSIPWKGEKMIRVIVYNTLRFETNFFFFPEKQNFPGTQSRDLFPVGSDKEGFI